MRLRALAAALVLVLVLGLAAGPAPAQDDPAAGQVRSPILTIDVDRLLAETRVLGEDLLLRATVEGGLLHFSEGNSRVTDRFFLGSRFIRGFERGGIGPRDRETDDALGGNAYAVVRLEAEFPLPLPEEYGLSGGAFVDYGSVWDVGVEGALADRVLYDDFTPRAVAGLSIFWDTPLGPLRFNFTEPIQVEEQDRPQSFDITVSTSF